MKKNVLPLQSAVNIMIANYKSSRGHQGHAFIEHGLITIYYVMISLLTSLAGFTAIHNARGAGLVALLKMSWDIVHSQKLERGIGGS